MIMNEDGVDPRAELGQQLDEMTVEMQDEVDEPVNQFGIKRIVLAKRWAQAVVARGSLRDWRVFSRPAIEGLSRKPSIAGRLKANR